MGDDFVSGQVIERYHLYTQIEPGAKWKPAALWTNRLDEMRSEISSCIHCGDAVRVVDTLRHKNIEQWELVKILNL